MAPRSIIKPFDVIKDIRLGFRPCCIDASFDLLLLQTAEEGFRNRVVVTIATPTHALQAGSNFIVVGRPITQAEDPLKAVHQWVSYLHVD